MAVESDLRYYHDELPYGFASLLLALDTFLNAIILSDRVYAITGCRVGIEHLPLVDNHPELPIEIIPPVPIDPRGFPREELKSFLLSNSTFFNLTYNEETEAYNILKPASTKPIQSPDYMTDVDATIAVGDLWRSMHLGLPLFANQIEAPICIYDQLIRLTQSDNLVKSTPQTIRETAMLLWRTKAGDRLKDYHFFTINAPLFLLEILRECKKPDDIWKVAMQRRNERDARYFRQWCAQINPGTSFESFSKEISDLSESMNSILTHRTELPALVSFELGLSPTMRVPFQDIGDSTHSPNNHLRFFKRSFMNPMEKDKLDSEISRVFHLKIDEAHTIVRIIEQLDVAPT